MEEAVQRELDALSLISSAASLCPCAEGFVTSPQSYHVERQHGEALNFSVCFFSLVSLGAEAKILFQFPFRFSETLFIYLFIFITFRMRRVEM